MEQSVSTVRMTPWEVLRRGTVIPASPLALTASRNLNERRQRALWRYYAAAGAGGIAIGVHTTQFAIRDPKIGLFEPLLELGKDEMDRLDALRARGVNSGSSDTSAPLIRIGGICGRTPQALKEAQKLCELGYHAGLLSLAAMSDASEDELIDHCKAVAEVIPLVGFYLQKAVGGPKLSYTFWRRFLDIENVVAIKIAPFNRYQTLDVVRAAAESGRDDVALYTGNDDNIVLDLLTTFRFSVNGKLVERRIVGGLLGHWSVWTKKAVELLDQCHVITAQGNSIPKEMLTLAAQITDCNAAFFDAANDFAGCIAGVHEVLRRQGLLEGIWCLNPNETLSPGQSEEIDRVYKAYPQLNDDTFVKEHLDEWLSA
ncbi:MAG: dihydrodipicolinate synthase family protein [Armatimonadota bacterium]|nr:dihydrodipicolinate synthase family protein [Armatimonadota bacterium]